MAIDLTKLSQSELLQVVNATPLGMVLTRSRLDRIASATDRTARRIDGLRPELRNNKPVFV